MLSKFAWNEKIMQSFNEDQILPKNATARFSPKKRSGKFK